jgi:predicted Rossmann-fold nucleotide-binding protein
MPTAFISYSWDSEEHKKWVHKLATDLCASGVDAWLDQWEVRLGDSVTEFMQRCVSTADYVLLVCTEKFGEKANSLSGGVGYEQAIVTADLLNSQPPRGRFVCILRNGSPSLAIPRYMQSRLWVGFRDDAEYRRGLDQLLVHIFGRYDELKPPINLPPNTKRLRTMPHVDSTALRGWVLVAGTGPLRAFSNELKEAAQYLGKQLATNGYGLVTGGWTGVDETVARAFWETSSEQGLAPEDRLVQVIVKDDDPPFTAGQLFFVSKGREEWLEPIQRADAVLLLGGIGGTWKTGEMALEIHKPVLPLADTGGDAKRLYLQMLRDWNRFEWIKLSREQFQRIARPRLSGVDAAIELLGCLFGPARAV